MLKIADPGSVKLVVEKGEKHIDHSLTLRQANIKAATKLALVKSVSFVFYCARAPAVETDGRRSGMWPRGSENELLCCD